MPIGKAFLGGLFFLLLRFIVSLGFVHGWQASKEPTDPHHVFTVIQGEQEIVLVGTLHRLPGFNGEKSTLVLTSHSLRGKDSSTFTAVHGLVQLKLKGELPHLVPVLMPGDQLVVRAVLDRPRRFRNPGSFDYPAFLAKENIWITGKINAPAHIHRLEQEVGTGQTLRYLPERIRTRISSFLDQSLSPEMSSVYKALLIGESSGISTETLEDFKGSGCMHILSISGAHLSLLASFIFFTFYWLLRRSEFVILRFPVKKIAAGLCLPPLLVYTLLAGGNTPVVRSLIMVAVFMVAICADKQKSLFTPLALAALLILLWDPNSLLTASFQLSFAAVAAIVAVAPLVARLAVKEDQDASSITRSGQRVGRFMGAAFIVSLAVTVSTAPILLFYFNRVSLIGLVANLPVESLICFWSLPLGFLACPLIFIFPDVASFLLHGGAYGLDWSLKMAAFFNDFSFASLWLPTPSLTLIGFYYLTLLAAITLFSINRTRCVMAVSAWFIVLIFFFVPPAEIWKGEMRSSEMTILDVGQGSATVLQFPSGRRVLIDGGGSSSPSSGFNVGEDIIAPFLWHKGVANLDAIVITHADSDHYNAIPFLLSRFRPQTLWLNELSGHDPSWKQMMALAHMLHIEVKIPAPGETVLERDGASLINLGNPVERSAMSSNDRSLILRFSHGPLSCLFAGDISSSVESELLASKVSLQSTLLLSPHHGSSTSNSESFLKAVNPQFLLVSAGRFRPENFPAPEVRNRCDALGIKILNTAEEGAIRFAKEGEIVSKTGKNY